MSEQTFEKVLTANDTGESGSHQAGILIPKSQPELLALLPQLDSKQKNPDTWINMTDEHGNVWRFRYVYYNNKFHDESGTRNEYRITHTTEFFRAVGAAKGDTIILSGVPGTQRYFVSVCKDHRHEINEPESSTVIKLKGWRRAH